MKHSITDPATEAVKSPGEFARETFRQVPRQLSWWEQRKARRRAVNDALVVADLAIGSQLDEGDRQAAHDWTPDELGRLTSDMFAPHTLEVEFEPWCSVCGVPAVMVAGAWEHVHLQD